MLSHIDHLVLTVADIERTVAFYVDVLGMERETFEGGRTAVHAGAWKINLHQADRTFEPKAAHPTPGSADLCFIAARPLAEVVERLAEHGIPIELGPVSRSGARGAMTSVYLRDPDGNLIEIAAYARQEGPAG